MYIYIILNLGVQKIIKFPKKEGRGGGQDFFLYNMFWDRVGFGVKGSDSPEIS